MNNATNGIKVKRNGEKYDIGNITWTTTEAENGALDGAHHKATVTFNAEGRYEVSLSYTDKAGNAA